jgi:hypothetical protein
MIDQIDDRLTKWVEKVVENVRPSFAPPSDAEDGLAISLYLLEIVDDPRRSHTGRPRLQPSLRYLVTTRAGEPQDAHRLLGVLFYAAMENPDFEVELEPVASEFWSAFHIIPRPAFILRLPLPHDWNLPDLPLVAQNAALEISSPLKPLYGQVFGPGKIPLAGARVELPNLSRYTTTGPHGTFSLTGVRSEPAMKTLLIKARGREQIVTTTENGTPANPVRFSFDILVTLYGQLLKEDRSPLAQAQIEIPALQLSTVSNDTGQFTLAAVPAAPAAKQLTFRSGGKVQTVSFQETDWAEAPVEFIFQPVA